MGYLIKQINKIFFIISKVNRRIKMYFLKYNFKSIGNNVIFDPSDSFSFETIEIGNDVFIAGGAIMHASDSSISIGNKVMIGPNITIMGGDHNTCTLGEYMYDIHTKLPENDLPVKIEDDIWIGVNVTILKGVVIGKGSIIAAGAVVTKSCEPYSVLAGIPAKTIKKRFSETNLKKHIKILNEKGSRCVE